MLVSSNASPLEPSLVVIFKGLHNADQTHQAQQPHLSKPVCRKAGWRPGTGHDSNLKDAVIHLKSQH